MGGSKTERPGAGLQASTLIIEHFRHLTDDQRAAEIASIEATRAHLGLPTAESQD